jgi:hypothetical protein
MKIAPIRLIRTNLPVLVYLSSNFIISAIHALLGYPANITEILLNIMKAGVKKKRMG